jgi:hypothetical protein
MSSKTGIEVELIGRDGNAFMILGTVIKQTKRNKVSQEVIDQYKKEATSGDYDNLLRVTMEYVEVL